MKNIVFLSEHGHFRDWTGKSYYDLITYVKQNNISWNITLFWDDEPEDLLFKKIKSLNACLIIYFSTEMTIRADIKINLINNLKIPVYFTLLDMFYPSKMFVPDIGKGLIHFGNHKAYEKFYKTAFPNKNILCFSSRFINVNKFKDYQLEKKYDILIYGTRTFKSSYKKEKIDSIQSYIKKYENYNNTIIDINADIYFYPLRVKIENILNKLTSKYKVLILPEKCIYDATIANEELSMLINQSYLTIACPSIADVLMHKFLEIAASKSVILGKYPSDYKDLFEGNMIEVDEFMEDEKIIKIIDDALSDKKKLEEMSERLYKRVHEEHNFDKAIENFNEVMDKILEQ